MQYRKRLEGIDGIKLSPVQENVTANYAYFPVVFDGYKYNRDEVYEKLKAEDIVARKYFYPLTNDFECYKDMSWADKNATPVARYIAERVLTLPMYADLAHEDIDKICDIILK